MKLTIYTTIEGVWGGSEMLWFDVAKIALKAGHEVQVCIKYSEKENFRIKLLEESGAVITRRKPIWLSKYKIYRRFTVPFFLKEIEKFKPQVILISQGGCFEFLYNYALFALIEKLSIPFFLISQFNFENGNILNKKFRLELQELKTKWTKFYFVSERNLKCAERQSANRLPNVEIISNSLNILKKAKAEWHTESTLKLCCVARYNCDYKGQDILIEALAQPEFKQFNYKLNFYGEGPDKNYLFELVQFYNLQQFITINNHTNKVDEIFETHHVLILPSIYEGMPLVLQECMVKGRPALTTNVGGCKTLMDNNTGFLAESCSVDSLKPALIKLFDTPFDKLKLMGDAAHKKAIKTINFHSADKIFSDMKNMII